MAIVDVCMMVFGSIARFPQLTTAVLTAYLVRGNEVYLWRSFVTIELVPVLGLKNRHGHWLCWMPTGRNNEPF